MIQQQWAAYHTIQHEAFEDVPDVHSHMQCREGCQYPMFFFQVPANFFFIVMTTGQELGH
jgi:hypothetical protein